MAAAGTVAPHHIHPESTWTTRSLRDEGDADDIVALLRINYDRVTSR
jgi:hypothetical protein